MELIKISEKMYEEILNPIEKTANKGTNGTLNIIAGSKNYRGAACLAVGGAMKTGVGIVRLISVEKAVECTAYNYPSCTFLTIIPDSDGVMDSVDFMKKYPTVREKCNAVLCGCGLGISNKTMNILRDTVMHAVPVVFDADALNLLSHEITLLKRRKAPTVITPHIGEMSRLCGKTIQEIKNDREKFALDFAVRYGITIVLKDDITYIATPEGKVFESALGNEGLSKGGSGDVLAGFIAGFLAQGYSTEDAAVLGCILQAKKAREAADGVGVREMRPEDLLC